MLDMNTSLSSERLTQLIDMLASIARMDFSKKLETNMSDDPMDVLGYGLNMLSEELEHKVNEKQNLEDSNKSLESFSFTVAHDLKSPALASIGVIDLMENELRSGEEVSKESLLQYTSLLKTASGQMIKMINGILEYSRLEKEKLTKQKVDLENLCNGLVESYALLKHVTIDVQNDLPMVHYNEVALEQVFNNLIGNAIKHNDKDYCHIRIEHSLKDEFHYISIVDNGPGIREEEQGVIFNLFENLRNNKTESSGIGLAIVDKIVSRSKGKVWVEPGDDTGAKFTFTIPYLQDLQ